MIDYEKMKLSKIIPLLTITLSISCPSCDSRHKKEQTEEKNKPEETREASDPISAENEQIEIEERKNSGDSMKDGPKLRHPKLSDSREENSIRDSLWSELAGIDPSSKKFAEKVTHMWNSNLSLISERSFPSANKDPEIGSGTLLPEEFIDVVRNNRISDSSQAYQMLEGISLVIAAFRSDLFVSLVSERANSLPPNEKDTAIFKVLNNGINDVSSVKKTFALEPWLHFSKSKNPIYRMLALRAISRGATMESIHISPEDPEYNRINVPVKLEFYLSYMKEHDPVILSEAIKLIGTLPLPEATENLENILQLHEKNNNEFLINATKNALKTNYAMSGKHYPE